MQTDPARRPLWLRADEGTGRIRAWFLFAQQRPGDSAGSDEPLGNGGRPGGVLSQVDGLPVGKASQSACS